MKTLKELQDKLNKNHSSLYTRFLPIYILNVSFSDFSTSNYYSIEDEDGDFTLYKNERLSREDVRMYVDYDVKIGTYTLSKIYKILQLLLTK